MPSHTVPCRALQAGFGALVNEPGDMTGSATRALSHLSLRRSASSAAALGSAIKHASPRKPPPPPRSRVAPAPGPHRSRPSPQEARVTPHEPALDLTNEAAASPPRLLPGIDYGVPTHLDLYAASAGPQAGGSPQGLSRLRRLEMAPAESGTGGGAAFAAGTSHSPTKASPPKRLVLVEATTGGAAAKQRAAEQLRSPAFDVTPTAEVNATAGVGSVTEVSLGPKAGAVPLADNLDAISRNERGVMPKEGVPAEPSSPYAGSRHRESAIEIGRPQGIAQGSGQGSAQASGQARGYLASGTKPARVAVQLSAEPLPPIDRDPSPLGLASVGDPRLSFK